jgi:hypothetical protein
MITQPELEALLQKMRRCLASPTSIDESVLAEHAAHYGQICGELNLKLLQAAKLIDRGLRDDALTLLGPDNEIIELFELCEFPERDDWCELIEIFGLEAPPPLDFDAAAKVNHAFALLGDLEGLLNIHRALALSRAPLAQRMQVLHALAKRDTENPIWNDDLRTFRDFRKRQLVEEIDQAISSEDYSRIELLKREMEGPVWTGSVDPKLLTKLVNSLAMRDQQELLKTIDDTGSKLREAYSEFDVEHGLELADALLDLLDKAKLAPDSQLVQDLEPVLAWAENQRRELEKQRQEAQLLEQLIYQLESAKESEPLELAYQKFLSTGSNLSQEIAARVEQRLSIFQMQARRRLIAIVSSLTICLLAIGIGLSLWIRSSQREAYAKQIEVALSSLIQNEQLDEAERLAGKQPPEIQSRVTIQNSIAEIAFQREQEAKRLKEFDQVLKELNEEDSAEPNERLLKRLKELAKTPPEKTLLAEQERMSEQKRLEFKKARQAKLIESYKELESNVASILIDRQSPQASIDSLNAIKSQVNQFLQQVSRDEGSISDTAQQLLRRIDREVEVYADRIRAEKDLDKITTEVGDINRFRGAIDAYRSQYPGSLSTIDLEKRVTDIKLDAIWIELVANDLISNPDKMNSASASKWIQLYDQVKDSNEAHCLHSFVKDSVNRIRAQSKVDQAIENLVKISQSNLLRETYVYPFKGAKYYSPDPPSEKRSQVDYYVDFTLVTEKVEFGETYRFRVLPFVKESGQSVFGKKFRKLTSSLKADQFNSVCYKILSELNAVSLDTIDPIFKLKLYRALLNEMIPASPAIAAGMEDFYRGLEDDSVDWDTNWLSVELKNPKLNSERDKADLKLHGLDDWDARRQRMSDAFQSKLKSEPNRLEWVGWICRNPEGLFGICKESSRNYELLVLLHERVATSQIVKLGIHSETRFLVTDVRIPVGSPIYALIPILRK